MLSTVRSNFAAPHGYISINTQIKTQKWCLDELRDNMSLILLMYINVHVINVMCNIKRKNF